MVHQEGFEYRAFTALLLTCNWVYLHCCTGILYITICIYIYSIISKWKSARYVNTNATSFGY